MLAEGSLRKPLALLVDHMWRDVRLACRSFARTPGFTLVAGFNLDP